MSTSVLATKPRTRKKRVSHDAEAVNKEDKLIDDAIKKMKPKLTRIGKRNLETITDLCEVGDDLNDLHAKCKHGNWRVRVEQELELDKTTVHRLRKLASSTLRDKMTLTIGQHLQGKLPSEIQKLVILTKVPDDKFSEFLTSFNPAQMTREELREAVVGKPKSKDGTSKKGRSKSSKSRTTKAKRSDALPIDQLFEFCDKSIDDLTASVQKQLDGDKVEQGSVEKVAAAVDHALICLNRLKKAVKEKLAHSPAVE